MRVYVCKRKCLKGSFKMREKKSQKDDLLPSSVEYRAVNKLWPIWRERSVYMQNRQKNLDNIFHHIFTVLHDNANKQNPKHIHTYHFNMVAYIIRVPFIKDNIIAQAVE